MISVVIPVYNEAENIGRLFARLTAAARHWGEEDYEVLVVDDGSKDASLAELANIRRIDPRWKILSFSRNFGHQVAVSAGIHYATGDAVVVMDADLQDPPEELGRFLAKWREGYHVVYAIRTKRKESAWKRLAYAAFYRILATISSIDIPLDSGDFCVMDRAVVRVLQSLPERNRFVRGLRSWSGFRQIGIEYERAARSAGAAKYTLGKLVRLALDGMLSVSSVPLKLSSWLGIGLCGLSGLLLAFVLVWRGSGVTLYGMKPSDSVGWTSLSSLVLFLSGLQFLVLGVMGEYLARLFEESKGRPPWVIATALGVEPPSDQPALGWFVPSTAESGIRQIEVGGRLGQAA